MQFLLIKNNLITLSSTIELLSDEDFTKPIVNLSNSTIGEHVRHIIELFDGLEKGYKIGIINYDDRERNKTIQTNKAFAISCLGTIINTFEKENKNLELNTLLVSANNLIQTNYYRELLYNYEHCIHHQALIKVAVLQNNNITIDANFGVARSTIEYRKQCAH